MKAKILWVDDEIDLLKPHILFLEERDYSVTPLCAGADALDELEGELPDLVLLDEQMPGLSGLDTLRQIKLRWPSLPVVMVTKSEEEHVMEDALGGKISDYLVKPVSPSQLLLTVKRLTEGRQLRQEHSAVDYQRQFRELSMQLDSGLDADGWCDMQRQLVRWDLELAGLDDSGVHEIFLTQRRDANRLFCRHVEEHYRHWLNGSEEKPLMSHTLLRERLFPLLKDGRPVFLIVIDNFRYDQWRTVLPMLEPYLRVERDELYYALLPTTTQFARNAMFAGLLPSEIERKYPQYWVNEDEEGHKNQFESELLGENLRRHGINIKHSYSKVLNAQFGMKLVDRLPELMRNGLNVVVYNFIDMLSHARTDSNIVRELAADERGYRSVTQSWMEHSPLLALLKALAERDVNILLTTDHGSVRVERPVRVKGDRDISVNLRYKQGRLLDYNPRDVYEEKDPAAIFLPRRHVTGSYIFCRENDFFAYPNNYNQYVQYYTDTFQHGGLSMEEVLVPVALLRPKP